MTTAPRSFLPESLRPKPKAAPRSRIGGWIRLAISVVALAVTTWLVLSWRIDAVEVTTCAGLPEGIAADLRGLRGQWVPAVDLGWVRRHAERWPGVAAVDVELRLPGTLVVHAVEEEVCASFRVGMGWRALSCDGQPGRRLEQPHLPVLTGFAVDAVQMRCGLAVGRRIAGGSLVDVLGVRQVTPVDLEVRLAPLQNGGEPVVVRVIPSGSRSEAWWLEEREHGAAPRWADLRFDDRVVVGGLG